MGAVMADYQAIYDISDCVSIPIYPIVWVYQYQLNIPDRLQREQRSSHSCDIT